MRSQKKMWVLSLLILGVLSSVAYADKKGKLLNRSIYMPIEFQLCEHLDHAVFYENDAPVSTMPAKRTFQFTYYPAHDALLPELVRVRVEGRYVDDAEPFVAKLAVSANGVHTANRFKSADTEEFVRKQSHKIDVRLEPKNIKLSCKRFCRRKATTVASKGTP